MDDIRGFDEDELDDGLLPLTDIPLLADEDDPLALVEEDELDPLANGFTAIEEEEPLL